MISCIFWFILIYLGDDSDEDEDDEDDADQNILSSDEDEIDEESAMYLESLQDKLNKSTNGNISVSFWKLNDFANFFFSRIFTKNFLSFFRSTHPLKTMKMTRMRTMMTNSITRYVFLFFLSFWI